MILPGKFFTDSALHETRQGGQDVYRRVDLSVVELSVDENLTLRDITGQIRDGVSDI